MAAVAAIFDFLIFLIFLRGGVDIGGSTPPGGLICRNQPPQGGVDPPGSTPPGGLINPPWLARPAQPAWPASPAGPAGPAVYQPSTPPGGLIPGDQPPLIYMSVLYVGKTLIG